MKNILTCGFLLVATGTTAFAAERLSEQELAYAAMHTTSVYVMTVCPKYGYDLEASKKVADRIGVDRDKIVAAFGAAFSAQLGVKYDREDLIPEVTRIMNLALVGIEKEYKSDRANFCKVNGELGIQAGFMKLR